MDIPAILHFLKEQFFLFKEKGNHLHGVFHTHACTISREHRIEFIVHQQYYYLNCNYDGVDGEALRYIQIKRSMANSGCGKDPDIIQEGDTVVFDVNNKLKVQFVKVKSGRWVFHVF